MTPDTPTAALASFVAETPDTAAPQAARDRALDAISDVIGVMIAGSRSRIGRRIRAYVTPTPSGVASVVPGRDRSHPELAALANGTAAHALDFDDTSHPGHTHPSAVLFPAVLATAQAIGSTGRGLTTAYLVGFEVQAALGRAMNIAHYEAGWHATSTLGALAAAGAASRVAGLTSVQVEQALGIATSAAGGLIANFGTMTKPLHAGVAAAAGVRAALLARDGWTARSGILDSPGGFAEVLSGGTSPDLEALTKDLGQRWTIVEPVGLAIKADPTCGATHPALDALLSICDRIGDRSARSVTVGTSALLPRVLTEHTPQTPEAARFSLEFTLAAALVRRRVTLDEVSAAGLDDPEIRSAMTLIRQEVDPRVADSREYSAIVRVELDDGSMEEARVDVARGKNANPLAPEDLQRKFAACVGDGHASVWEAIRLLDVEQPLDSLVHRLACLEGLDSG